MSKNLYSLMLLDEVVEAVDQMAYQRNMNRSQLINDILAQAVGYITPERRVTNIINQIVESLDHQEGFQIKAKSESGSLQMGTFLRYKYKPRIKYSFEFVTRREEGFVLLKVNTRTKSPDLNHHLKEFFKILTAVDRYRFDEIHAREVVSNISDVSNNRYTREFLSGISLEGVREEDIAEYMSNYIKMLDESLKVYFNNLEYPGEIITVIDRIYCKYMRNLKLFSSK